MSLEGLNRSRFDQDRKSMRPVTAHGNPASAADPDPLLSIAAASFGEQGQSSSIDLGDLPVKMAITQARLDEAAWTRPVDMVQAAHAVELIADGVLEGVGDVELDSVTERFGFMLTESEREAIRTAVEQNPAIVASSASTRLAATDAEARRVAEDRAGPVVAAVLRVVRRYLPTMLATGRITRARAPRGSAVGSWSDEAGSTVESQMTWPVSGGAGSAAAVAGFRSERDIHAATGVSGLWNAPASWSTSSRHVRVRMSAWHGALGRGRGRDARRRPCCNAISLSFCPFCSGRVQIGRTWGGAGCGRAGFVHEMSSWVVRSRRRASLPRMPRPGVRLLCRGAMRPQWVLASTAVVAHAIVRDRRRELH